MEFGVRMELLRQLSHENFLQAITQGVSLRLCRGVF